MDCPGCSVELVQLPGDDSTISRCPECAGLWLDIAEVNRILLHHNMPGLESLGGRANVDAPSGPCPECQVDLVVVENGDRRNLVAYDTCEVCGGIFLETDSPTADLPTATKSIVEFYRRFHPTKAAKHA